MTTQATGMQSAPASPAGAPALADFAPGIEKAFPAQFEEWEGRLECVAGEVPEFAQGTYYVNGPARFKSGDLQYRHWLDGDGMVCRLHFDSTGIHFRSRYIRSRKLMSEREAGHALFRTFGTSFPHDRLNRLNQGLESPVNISVYPFAGQLLAFGEQGLPWKLDPETLETLGQFTASGRLNDASPMAAHARFDARTGEMFNFGILYSAETPRLYFYCFIRDILRYRQSVALPYPCSVHDFSLTEHYAVFYLSPYIMDIESFLRGGRTVMESLHWRPERGSRLLIVDRSNGELAGSIDIGRRYCLHLISAFERDGRLVVDVLEFDAPIYSQYQPIPDLFADVTRGGPVRFVVDLNSHELFQRVALDYLQAPDFPAIDPRGAMQAHEEFWMLGISAAGNRGRKFFDQLVHARWKRDQEFDIYQCPQHRYLGGEPAFIGEPGSSRGAIMCQEFNAVDPCSNFVLFDAQRVSQGPIARIALKRPLYLGFHAVFQHKTH